MKTILGTAALAILLTTSVAAQTKGLPTAPTNKAELNALEREIANKERGLDKYMSELRRLESAGKKSSNSDRDRSIGRIEKAMAEMIRFEESKLGDEYLLTMHGQEVDVVHTSESGSTTGTGVRTGTKNRQRPPEGAPPVYLRLRSMQQIFTSCQTIRQMAISGQGDMFSRYEAQSHDFARLLREDLAELRGLLPEDDVELSE